LSMIGRLLEPGRIELGEALAEPDRLGYAEGDMPLDHDLDVGSERLAPRAHDVERKLSIAWRHHAPGGAKGIELERLVPASDDLRRPLGEALRRAACGGPGRGET